MTGILFALSVVQGCGQAEKPTRPRIGYSEVEESGPGPIGDTGADSADTADTDDTNDSAEDTGADVPGCFVAPDTGSIPPLPEWTREPMDPVWRGGDAVPGWEDRDCPYRYGPDVLHLDYRTQWEGDMSYGRNFESPGPPRMALYRHMPYDLIKEPGSGNGVVFIFDLILWSQAGAGEGPPPGDVRGTGWFGPWGTTERTTYLAGADTPFGPLRPSPDNHGGPAAQATCVRYAGPDRVTGSVYLAPYAPPGRRDGRSAYPVVSYEIDFEHRYPEHAATASDYAGVDAFPYWGRQVVYADGTPYAESWPWDEITDPAIRSAMFWRYMPANDPHCYEAMRRTGERP